MALISVHLIQPRDYNTGTDSVEVHGYVAVAQAREPVCVPGLLVPAGTSRLRFKVMSTARRRPALHLALQLGGRTIHSDLSPVVVRGSRISSAVFSIPQLAARPSATPATACLTADGVVSLGGTALSSPPGIGPPTVGGVPISARIAVWYLPPRGARQSYVEAAGAILARASLFRPGSVGPWLYVLMFLGVLPALAYASVRCLALAAGGRAQRRVAIWLFGIAAVNFACWALISPPFQLPDETDHFAYTQSLVERGQAPSRDPASSLRRWSSAETLALEAVDFFTDHRAADSRPPWLARQQREYSLQAAARHPRCR